MSAISTTWQAIRDNPWKIFFGTTGTIIFSIAGVFFSDARYAHASDVNKDKIAIEQRVLALEDQLKALQEKK